MAYALHVGIFSCDLAPVLSGLYMFVWTYLYTWLRSRKGKNVEPLNRWFPVKTLGHPKSATWLSSDVWTIHPSCSLARSYCNLAAVCHGSLSRCWRFWWTTSTIPCKKCHCGTSWKNHAAPCLVRRLCTSAPKKPWNILPEERSPWGFDILVDSKPQGCRTQLVCG